MVAKDIFSRRRSCLHPDTLAWISTSVGTFPGGGRKKERMKRVWHTNTQLVCTRGGASIYKSVHTFFADSLQTDGGIVCPYSELCML